jgi:hypothetical protein
LKKKKKKSSGSPKKAAKRAATGNVRKAAKRPSAKPKKAKPSAGKKGKKAPSLATKKAKRTANGNSQPICVENFSASNRSQVCFTGIPSNGSCDLFQLAGDIFPFQPVTGTNLQGLDFTTLTPTNNCVTIVVPAINQTYPYGVTCCGGADNPGHSVTVNS